MTDEERLDLWGNDAFDTVTTGWILLKHTKTDREYTYLQVVIREKDLHPCFTYYDGKKGLTWMRPLCDLFAIEEDGRPKWTWRQRDAAFFSELHATYLEHLGEENGPKGVYPF